MRTLIIIAIAIGLAHTAFGAIIGAVETQTSYNTQLEAAITTASAK